jgi:hypothetical protein
MRATGPVVGNTPGTTRINGAVCVLAGVAAVADGTCWAITFTPWARILPSWFFAPFFVLVFPVVAWTVLITPRHRPFDLLTALPRPVAVSLGAAAAVIAAATGTGIQGLRGQPGYDAQKHQYVLNDHDTQITVTRAAYLHAVALQSRLFLGVSLILLGMAATLTCLERQRRLREPSGPAVPRQPMRGNRPKIPVPGPVLAVVAVVGLGSAVACGILIVHRLGDQYGGSQTISLRTEQPVTRMLMPDEYTVFVGCGSNYDCGALSPDGLAVQLPAGGTIGQMVPDPSNDDMSIDGLPDVGRLDFRVPEKELIRFDLTAQVGQPVYVLPSEGAEVHTLFGWIVLGVGSLLIAIVALVGLAYLLAWRLGLGTARPPAYTFPVNQAVYPYPSYPYRSPPPSGSPPDGSRPLGPP